MLLDDIVSNAKNCLPKVTFSLVILFTAKFAAAEKELKRFPKVYSRVTPIREAKYCFPSFSWSSISFDVAARQQGRYADW